MENQNVMEKYRRFVDDYNSGLDRGRLCGKYSLPEEKFDSFLSFLQGKGFVLVESRCVLAHDIGFQIMGDDLQFVEIELEPGQTAVAEAGALMYMDSSIGMETMLGDGSSSSGIGGMVLGAGKRMLSGATLFMTAFTNHGAGKGKVAFAAPYPGKIVPLEVGQLGGEMICQSESFLCAAKGVSIDIAFQRDIRVGIFGGNGFIMQRLKGDGVAFVHAGGTLVQKKLQPGERLKIDAGCLVALQPQVEFNIEYVGGIKNAMFGGEGAFFATATGPGTVWLQSLPFSRLVAHIDARLPRREEHKPSPVSMVTSQSKDGSLLDSFGGIGGVVGSLFGNKDQ